LDPGTIQSFYLAYLATNLLYLLVRVVSCQMWSLVSKCYTHSCPTSLMLLLTRPSWARSGATSCQGDSHNLHYRRILFVQGLWRNLY